MPGTRWRRPSRWRGATPVFADINYWTGCLSPEKAALKISPQTRAILAGNTNGHPADWGPLRALAGGGTGSS